MADSTMADSATPTKECIICSSTIGQPRDDGSVEAGVTLPCSHSFGLRCLALAARNNNRCPMCRTQMHWDILSDLTNIRAGLVGNLTGDRETREGDGTRMTWRELDDRENERDLGPEGDRFIDLTGEEELDVGGSGYVIGDSFQRYPYEDDEQDFEEEMTRAWDRRRDVLASRLDALASASRAPISPPPTTRRFEPVDVMYDNARQAIAAIRTIHPSEPTTSTATTTPVPTRHPFRFAPPYASTPIRPNRNAAVETNSRAYARARVVHRRLEELDARRALRDRPSNDHNGIEMVSHRDGAMEPETLGRTRSWTRAREEGSGRVHYRQYGFGPR
jgi:hypothetical protein